MRSLAVLMTSFNRKDKTLRCLESVYSNPLPGDMALRVVLVDDASTDGTAEAVKTRFAAVELERGSGDLFWNRGMHCAFSNAMHGRPDFVLWLNDDTELAPRALLTLFEESEALQRTVGAPAIVVGAAVDRDTGAVTYAGLKRKGRARRFAFERVWSSRQTVECEAMNGNIVLIPRAVYSVVGNLDPTFEHAMGDIDYALRARRAGFRIFVAAGVAGYCSIDHGGVGHRDVSQPIVVRWQRFTGRKGLPPRSWLHFVRRHAGSLWPVYFTYPYANFVLQIVRDRLGRSRE